MASVLVAAIAGYFYLVETLTLQRLIRQPLRQIAKSQSRSWAVLRSYGAAIWGRWVLNVVERAGETAGAADATAALGAEMFGDINNVVIPGGLIKSD